MLCFVTYVKNGLFRWEVMLNFFTESKSWRNEEALVDKRTMEVWKIVGVIDFPEKKKLRNLDFKPTISKPEHLIWVPILIIRTEDSHSKACCV